MAQWRTGHHGDSVMRDELVDIGGAQMEGGSEGALGASYAGRQHVRTANDRFFLNVA